MTCSVPALVGSSDSEARPCSVERTVVSWMMLVVAGSSTGRPGQLRMVVRPRWAEEVVQLAEAIK